MGQTDYADFARLGERGGEGREGKGGYSIVDYLAEEGKIGYRGRVLYAIIYNVNRLGKGYSKFPITSCIARPLSQALTEQLHGQVGELQKQRQI